MWNYLQVVWVFSTFFIHRENVAGETRRASFQFQTLVPHVIVQVLQQHILQQVKH